MNMMWSTPSPSQGNWGNPDLLGGPVGHTTRECSHLPDGIWRSVMVLGLMVLYSIRAFRRGAGDILARGKVRNESSASFGVGNTGINEIIVEPEVTMTNKASHDSAGFLFINTLDGYSQNSLPSINHFTPKFKKVHSPNLLRRNV